MAGTPQALGGPKSKPFFLERYPEQPVTTPGTLWFANCLDYDKHLKEKMA